ncbi:MAG: hypothetical protein ABR971_02750 [Acidobacteriaceae bacterium]|jgi:hypothetical protein
MAQQLPYWKYVCDAQPTQAEPETFREKSGRGIEAMLQNTVWRNPLPVNTETPALQRIESVQLDALHAVTPPCLIENFEGSSGRISRIRILDPFSKREHMLKIQRSSNGQVVFVVSGHMDEEDIPELEVLLRSEKSDCRIVLDLKDLTLAGRDAIRFLGRCEADGITLKNCAVYVREWITRERRES